MLILIIYRRILIRDLKRYIIYLNILNNLRF